MFAARSCTPRFRRAACSPADGALKAALASIGAEFPFTHDLGLLMQLCEDADLDLPNSLAEADLLTPYAAQLRYGSSQSATVSRAQALEFAIEARSWAASLV